MKVINLYFLVILTVLLSCKQEKATVDQDIHTEQINKIELLVQSVLNMEEFQAPFNRIKNNKEEEFFIIKQDSFGITQDLKLKKSNKDIRLLDYNQAKKNDISNIIYFREFSLKENTAKVKCFYAFEGLGCDAEFVFKNGNWNEVSSEFWYE